MRRIYFAAIHKDPDSDYTAIFPGVPGVITAGSTPEELDAMVREALQAHLDMARDYGDPIPSPLSLEEAKAHEDGLGAEFYLAVAVQVESGKAHRLNISMPQDLIEEVDLYSKRRGLSRSAFLAQAARQAMQRGA